MIRERHADNRLLTTRAVLWRNFEASLDTALLEPRTRMFSTYLLQEYFVPAAVLLPFVRQMSRILQQHRVNALNVSIRHSPADTGSLLRRATTEVFSFVLYYKQQTSHAADIAAQRWIRELIDAARAAGGRYYLPYRLHATVTVPARLSGGGGIRADQARGRSDEPIPQSALGQILAGMARRIGAGFRSTGRGRAHRRVSIDGAEQGRAWLNYRDSYRSKSAYERHPR